ncbi:MAG: BamA/TamA family outer membrane protein [Flavobacteriales bacterium]|nr:BamA/TamA family outer membrane protein [Flavobacteriales bacterium]
MDHVNVQRVLLFCFLWSTSVATVFAQKHRIEFTCDQEIPERWIRPEDAGSLQQLPSVLSAQLAYLHGQGYLEASIDGCVTDTVGRRSTCAITLGREYHWAQLSGAGIPTEIASEARFREKLYTNRPVTPKNVQRTVEGLLQWSEDHGYPFATVRLDSLRRDADGMRAVVRLDRGKLVRVDSVLVRGTARTSLPYLHAHIGIRPGDLYNESLVRNVERRTRELPFVTQRQRPYVQFTPERTKLVLFLDAKKASSINGILGVQPDPVTRDVKITGDLDLRLRNALKRGEAIELNWRSLADATQDLRVRFNMPFVLRTPFGTDATFKLFKRDTTFLEVNARGTLEYLMTRGDKLGLFVNTKSNERLGRNTASTPGLGDVKILSYGLMLSRERFDYRLNPRRGHSAQLESSVGRKRTNTAYFGQENPPAEIRTVQYELEGRSVVHIPIRRRSTIRIAGQGGWMVNDNLYTNELYRIGGLKTMRGVDEASIRCSSYAIGTLEYRFVYEENANFFAFVDQGWWEDAARDQLLTDTPLGFGVGTTFETKAGLFGLTYALGRQFDNPILLRGGKIHFGFTSLF